MNRAALVLLLAAVGQGSASLCIPGVTCPPVGDPCVGSAKQPTVGDCSSFLQCVDGLLELHTCGWLSYFDSVTNECRYFWKATCSDMQNLDQCTGNWNLPDPKDCSHYYTCTNGRMKHHWCSILRGYNRETHKCDWSWKVPYCLPDAVCLEDRTRAIPNNCSYYEECQQGQWVVNECLFNEKFDKDSLKCKPEIEVSCLTSVRSKREANWMKLMVEDEPTGEPTTPGPTAPTEGPTAPTEGPTGSTEGPTAPTEGPTGPTEGPTAPTEGPTGPTEGPTGPTEGPAGPTEGPTGPTEGPTGPTEGPSGPTEGPTAPTEGPTAPTEGPTEGPTSPTEGPTGPTEGPTAPTEGPTAPTEGPTSPTEGPTTSTEPTLPPTTEKPECAPGQKIHVANSCTDYYLCDTDSKWILASCSSWCKHFNGQKCVWAWQFPCTVTTTPAPTQPSTIATEGPSGGSTKPTPSGSSTTPTPTTDPPTTVSTTTVAPCKEGEVEGIKGDCRNYMQCKQGKFVKETCSWIDDFDCNYKECRTRLWATCC